MHPATRLLESAIETIQQEKAAFLAEDMDLLDDLIKKRLDLQQKAWVLREGYAEEEFLHQLQKLISLHDELFQDCSEELQRLRVQLGTAKRQAGYFSGEKERDAYEKKRRLFDKIY